MQMQSWSLERNSDRKPPSNLDGGFLVVDEIVGL